MDYSKAGTPKIHKDAPRHSEHNAKGSTENPFGDAGPGSKAELLARMKAAAEARKATKA
ncbi:hypothetical protein [Paenirhodobacter enshiensis]|uniref:Cobalt chelatase n=1 Tax=Paenirhodobacter enshiensis TaxID=1105367 RepID=A0A086Y669_9RHOB|nr:hypothetical protein [Paenirhodobacter enshiensis]KFI29769.1 cobalt chelatase [Paenirhodobacter enshiensis]